MNSEVHHQRLARFVKEDPYIQHLEANETFRCLRDSSIQYVARDTIHGSIGKMLAWNYLDTATQETVSAIRFLWGAQGPPGCAHGGQVTVALDHCFGHCMRAVLGVGPQFTTRLRTELKKPVPLATTLSARVRITDKSLRLKGDGKDGRLTVTLSATIAATVPGGAIGEELVSGLCTFVAFTDAEGKLSKHLPPGSSQLSRHHDTAERQHRASPVVYDDLGRILAPGPAMQYFSCRGGAARCWEPTRQWVESSPEVARLSAEPGLEEMTLEYARRNFLPHGGRWLPPSLPAEILAELRMYGEVAPAVSSSDNRIMECYFAETARPRAIGALRFNRAAAGPPGRAHGGLIAAALDEAFVWAGIHIGQGPTAWLDVSLRGPAFLETTLLVSVELERVETSKSGLFKLFMRALLCQPKPEAVAKKDVPLAEIISTAAPVADATTLLICRDLPARWRNISEANRAAAL